jgi:hypothetical protein
MKYIKLFEDLQGFEYWPDIILEQGIRRGQVLKVYHGTPNKELRVDHEPIHVGTSEQTDTRIESLWNEYPVFYEHRIKIELVDPCPRILYDIDLGVGHAPEDFTQYGDYNEFVYHNEVEGYPEEEGNLSIFIVDFQKSYLSSRVIAVIPTR